MILSLKRWLFKRLESKQDCLDISAQATSFHDSFLSELTLVFFFFLPLT